MHGESTIWLPSKLVKATFATAAFPLFGIDVFHSDCGSESGSDARGELFEVFGITRSLSKKGCPYNSAFSVLLVDSVLA